MPRNPERQLNFLKLTHNLYTILNVTMAILFDLFAYTIFQSYLNIDTIKKNNPDVQAEDIFLLFWFILGISFIYWLGALFSALIAKKILTKEAYPMVKKMTLYECIVLPIGPLIGILTWQMLNKPSIKAFYETEREPS